MATLDDLQALLKSLPASSANYGVVQGLLNNPTLLASSIGQNQLANVVGTAQQDVQAAQNPTYFYTDPTGVPRTTTDRSQIPAGSSNIKTSASGLSTTYDPSLVSRLAGNLAPGSLPGSAPSGSGADPTITETGQSGTGNWSPQSATRGPGISDPTGGVGNSAVGDNPGSILQQIFGGQNFNLGNVLPATLSSAAAILSYLGTDSAFNKAGNLVNNAETAAGNQVNNAATAAGQNVVDTTGSANGILNNLLNNFTGSTNPYTSAGATAAGDLQNGLAPGGALNPGPLTADQMLQQDPGYQFRLGQGDEAAKAQLAAEGLGGSGEAVKQLDQFNQDFASNEYNNTFQRQQEGIQNLFSRLLGTSQVGQTAEGQNLTAAENLGAPMASNLINGATTQGMFNTQGSQYQGNANVAGAGAQAGATIDANQAKQAMIQQLLNSFLSLFHNNQSGVPTGGASPVSSLLSQFFGGGGQPALA